MTGTQIDLSVAGQMQKRQPSVMELMQIAIERGQVEQLQILQEMQFKQQDREAAIDFNEAMNACQSELKPISADMENPQTRSKYASYAQLDRAIRPVYTRHGLSLSFSEEDSPKADHVRTICYVSKGAHTRIYRKDMPVTTKGIKGNEMMTPTHATATAESYSKRYIVKSIFNLAIGEEDTDGNAPDAKPAPAMNQKEFEERLAFFPKCSTLAELQDHFVASFKEARKYDDERAKDAFYKAKEERKAQLKEVKQ